MLKTSIREILFGVSILLYGPFSMLSATVTTRALPASQIIRTFERKNLTPAGPGHRIPYSAAPDIALNHPQRWAQKEPSGVNPQQVQFNCPVGYTSSLSSPTCTSSPQQPTPRNVADDVFYEMKGLFVTPGNTIDGPQITSTTLGSKVNLKARVYNYSLANLPAGAVLHVQFYAQPWDAGQFASDPNDPNRFAEAIFIGEGTNASNNPLAHIPAYCDGITGGTDPCVNSTTRNWEYAYAT
jgi:hypothetical protein